VLRSTTKLCFPNFGLWCVQREVKSEVDAVKGRKTTHAPNRTRTTTMQVTSANLEEGIAALRSALGSAEFVAVDTEFSGLNSGGASTTQHDTVPTHYEKMRQSVRSFMLLQYGICTFERVVDDEDGSERLVVWVGG
jgi:CAF1 family ribonuclease